MPIARLHNKLESLSLEFRQTFLSRKFWVFGMATISGAWLLWKKILPSEPYVQLSIWLCLIYFVGNTAQKFLDKNPKPQPVGKRIQSSKFLSTVAMLTFFNFAAYAKVLPPDAYVTLVLWWTGLYFGIDVATIYAFKDGLKSKEGLRAFFRNPDEGETETSTVKTEVSVGLAVQKTETVPAAPAPAATQVQENVQ